MKTAEEMFKERTKNIKADARLFLFADVIYELMESYASQFRDKELIEKQAELIKCYEFRLSFTDLDDREITLKSEISALKEAKEPTLSDPNLCCICHKNYVDSADGYDTCEWCLKNI